MRNTQRHHLAGLVRLGSVVTVTAATIVFAAYAATGYRGADQSVGHGDRSGQRLWQASWRTAPQPPLASGVSHAGFTNQTVRMVIRPTVSGSAVRLRLSNAYGTAGLRVGQVAVAEQDRGPLVVARTQRVVSFDGAVAVTVAPGDEAISDPVSMPVRRGHNLVVSVYLVGATGPATWHNKAQTTSYVSGPGNWATEPGGSPYQSIVPSWFFLDGLDVSSRPVAGTVVAFGDSITDGAFSTIDAAQTYPDWLSRRFADLAVLNEGIGGNRLLSDTVGGGDSGLHRFGRDVLDQPGVSTVVVLEGVNDIGADATAAQLIEALTQLAVQAHAQCVRVVGATITPFRGSVYDTSAHEQTRQAVNEWIRTSDAFDAVADFDRVLRDPADPLTIAPRYHTVGDLHPNDRGYQAMANALSRADLAAPRSCRHG
jgi:lysophospholipase L1-like esterase